MAHTPNPTGKGGFKENPQNINKNGRPEGISITKMVREALETVEPKTGKYWKDLIVKRILIKAVNDGDQQMIKAVWAYMDGMPQQSTDITSNGMPISPSITVMSEEAKKNLEKLYEGSDSSNE